MFASVGSLGTASTKTAGQELTFSPSRDVAVGQLVVIYWGWDGGRNIGEAADGMNERWSCFDDAGNIWSTVASRSEGFGHSAGGIFISRLRSGLLTTDTVTLRCQITLREPKALSAWEFDIDPNRRPASAESSPNGDDQLVQQPNDLGFSGDLQEYLMLYCLSSRGPDTDDVDLDSDYTPVTPVGTTGGLAFSNVNLRGAFRIATLSGDTVSAINNTAARDCSYSLVALSEGRYKPEGPRTSLYDDFNRADEDPLDGGLWELLPNIPTFNEEGRIVSNVARSGGSWSLALHDKECAEVYASIAALGNLGAGLILHGTGSGNNSTRAGYEFSALPIQAKADRDRFEIGEAGFNANVDRAYQILWRSPTTSDRLLLRRNKKIISGHLFIDGDWEWVVSVYSSNPNSRKSGKVGFEIFDTTTAIDDFGAGMFPCGLFVPQIYRRQFGSA